MFEEIRKPKLLVGIPMLLIRAFPAIFYYRRYKNEKTDLKTDELYQSKLTFLIRALRMIGKGMDQKEYSDLSRSAEVFYLENTQSMEEDFINFIIELSAICDTYKKTLRAYVKANRAGLRELYKDVVIPLQIVLIDYTGVQERVSALRNTLQNFCYYKVVTEKPDSHKYGSTLLQSDFGLFTTTFPPRIHDDVKSLKSYRRAGLAIAHLDEEEGRNAQSIRHGSQLQKIGFPVLFKIFTPLRLFTSIDKEYMRFNLG